MRYDVVVIGNDPRGFDAAMEAAVDGRRVVVVADGLDDRTAARLDLFGVDVVHGAARFASADEIVVRFGTRERRLAGCRFVLATGARIWRPAWIPFDGERVLAAEEDREPLGRTLVIGSGMYGIGHAIRQAERGRDVTIVDGPEAGLDVDRDAGYLDALDRAAEQGVRLHLGSEAIGVDRCDDVVEVELRSGVRLDGDSVLFAAGFEADTRSLDLPRIGLHTDERGRVWCDAEGRTWVAHVSAVGDVVARRSTGDETALDAPPVRRPHFERGRRATVRG